MNSTSSSSHRLLLVLACATAVFVAAIYGYLYYGILASSSRADIARGVIQSEQSDQDKAQEILSLYQSTMVARSRIGGFFVHSDNVVPFIVSLETVGRDSGSHVVVSNIATVDSGSTDIGSVGSVKAHIEADGSWGSVIRSLIMFETLPYNTKVDNLHLDGPAPSKSTAQPIAKNAQKTGWVMSLDITASTIVASSSQK